MNLRIAVAASGFSPHVHLLPDAEDPEVLARVTITPASGSRPP